jgi:magnesium-transporting ATPase (P-type)
MGLALKVAVEQHNLFAKLSPEDKARVVGRFKAMATWSAIWVMASMTPRL